MSFSRVCVAEDVYAEHTGNLKRKIDEIAAPLPEFTFELWHERAPKKDVLIVRHTMAPENTVARIAATEFHLCTQCLKDKGNVGPCGDTRCEKARRKRAHGLVSDKKYVVRPGDRIVFVDAKEGKRHSYGYDQLREAHTPYRNKCRIIKHPSGSKIKMTAETDDAVFLDSVEFIVRGYEDVKARLRKVRKCITELDGARLAIDEVNKQQREEMRDARIDHTRLALRVKETEAKLQELKREFSKTSDFISGKTPSAIDIPEETLKELQEKIKEHDSIEF